MVRWLAPILAFTAEEMWRHLSWQTGPSPFFSPHGTQLPPAAADRSTGSCCLRCASDVARELERLRIAGQIGAPLDAELDDLVRARTARAPCRARRRSCASSRDHSEASLHRVSPESITQLSADVARSPAAVPADAVRAASVPAACGSPCVPLRSRQVRALLASSPRRRCSMPRIRSSARAASAICRCLARRGGTVDGR